MSSFLNPIFLSRITWSYLTDIKRVRQKSEKEIEEYRNRCFRKMVRYAYSVPAYRKKYKEAGIHPDDIKNLRNVKKLPLITKNDLRKNFPNGVVPLGFDTKNAYLISTSGSTGQPVSIYVDTYTIIKALLGFIRELRECDVNWRKTRMTIIADVAPHAVEEAYLCGSVIPHLKRFFSFKNLQVLHVGDDPALLIQKIDNFQPEFLGGYPGVMRALAVLKRKGHGVHIHPKVMASSGAVLDDYTKNYIEDAFDAKIFDAYGSTEAGPVAFECKKGCYHIHSDLVHLEFVDEDGNYVENGKPGHVVVTKLYGGGTPIVRYTGMNDFIIPLDTTCDCGIHTPLLGRVGGRKADSIILKDGKIIPPSAITGIPGKIMHELETDKIQQFQIVQKDFEMIEILIVIDEELRHVGVPVENIFQELKKRYQEKFGESVEVVVREVNEIKKSKEVETPPSVVISKVHYSF